MAKIPPPPPSIRRQFVEPRPLVPWQYMLKTVGYPQTVLVLDFEAYFDQEYSMKKLTTAEYISDKRFEVLGLAHLQMSAEYPFAEYEKQVRFEVGEQAVASYIAYLRQMYGDELEKCTVVAQNATFDLSVLARRYGLFPRYPIDTLGLARHWNARNKNDLGSLCRQWGLVEKGETAEFTGLSFRRRFLPRKKKDKGPPTERPRITDHQVIALSNYACNDACREWEMFKLLVPRLSNPGSELWYMKQTTELFTRPSLLFDYHLAARLKETYAGKADLAVAETGHTKKEISGNTSFSALMSEALTWAGENPQRFYKVCKKGYKLADAKSDPERELMLNHANARVSSLMHARGAIKSWPSHIKRIDRLEAMANATNGLIPIALKYSGAHTGRDSGAEKVNQQNHPRVGELAAMRGLYIAPSGKKLIIVDEAAVEARGVAWLAKQTDLMQQFRENADVYSEFATRFYGKRVRKCKDDPDPVAEWHKTRRQFGKVCILGMGYGMGGKKFASFASTDIDTATKAVGLYRETFKQVPVLWRAIEQSFKYTATYQRPCDTHGIRFHSITDCDVVLTLPNGRELKYHKVRFKDGTPEVYNAMEKSWDHIWGGTLVENIVQAFCRDLLFESMKRLADRGYHTAHRVHDELVLIVPDEQAQECLNAAIEEFRRPPAWALDIPLNAEGAISTKYGGH